MKPLIAFVVFGVLMSASAALAAPPQAYSQAAMAAAQSAGKPVIVHVTASWCTTCAAQKPIVQSLLKEPKFKDVVVLDVDYDKEKDVMRAFHVQERSTFVAFKGKQEVGRSTGATDKASIQTLFDKTS